MKTLLITTFLFVNSLSISAQTWQTLSPTNNCTNRHENTLAAVEDKLILFGGRGIKPTEIYDIIHKRKRIGKLSLFFNFETWKFN
jgi:hypothetical protein